MDRSFPGTGVENHRRSIHFDFAGHVLTRQGVRRSAILLARYYYEKYHKQTDENYTVPHHRSNTGK